MSSATLWLVFITLVKTERRVILPIMKCDSTQSPPCLSFRTLRVPLFGVNESFQMLFTCGEPTVVSAKLLSGISSILETLHFGRVLKSCGVCFLSLFFFFLRFFLWLNVYIVLKLPSPQQGLRLKTLMNIQQQIYIRTVNLYLQPVCN